MGRVEDSKLMPQEYYRSRRGSRLRLWFAKSACGAAKTQVSISIASGSREPRRPDSGHVTLCYMVFCGNLNSPLNLFISFAKALMEQGFPSDPFLAKDRMTVWFIPLSSSAALTDQCWAESPKCRKQSTIESRHFCRASSSQDSLVGTCSSALLAGSPSHVALVRFAADSRTRQRCRARGRTGRVSGLQYQPCIQPANAPLRQCPCFVSWLFSRRWR